MDISNYRIVLASASPRRREILEKMGLEFEVCPSDKEETVISDDPAELCQALSRQKALDVASQIRAYNEAHPGITTPQDILVIGSDTVVFLENQVLGKPKDEEDAFRMLRKMQDRTHTVYTGVTFVFLAKNGKAGEYTFYDSTDVTFYPISDEEIRAYIATGEPMDKAGAYGIQGAFCKHLKGICGDYYNVMGLPAAKLYQELKAL